MPVSLVLIMTLSLDSTFRTQQFENVKIIIINNDSDIVGNNIISKLDSTNLFNITISEKSTDENIEVIKQKVLNGEYSLLIFIPENSTKKILVTVKNKIFSQLNMKDSIDNIGLTNNVELIFDPVIKSTFKSAISENLKRIISDIQMQIVYRSYSNALMQITGNENSGLLSEEILKVEEKSLKKKTLPSSTQHNIPAWTIFGIFFIALPLSEKMIFERNNGTLDRLKISPVSHYLFLLSKIIVYSFISLTQALLLIVIGVWLLPELGLPELKIYEFTTVINIVVFTFFVGISATAYGVLIGTIAKNQQQAAVFGSVSIVILSTIGGIMVPTYAMNGFMQNISVLSPLNWAINGYYDIFLRNKNIAFLYPDIIKLTSFFIVTMVLSVFVEKKMR